MSWVSRSILANRRKILVVLIVAAVAAIIAVAWKPDSPAEPVYNGKKLSEWIQISHLNSNERLRNEAQEAKRHIGTNAVPCLLEWIGAHPPAWSGIVPRLRNYGRIGRLLSDRLADYPVAVAERKWNAAYEFAALGESASNAIPALIKMLDSDDPHAFFPGNMQPPSAFALERMGESGQTAVLNWLSDPHSLNRNPHGVTTMIQFLRMVSPNGTNADRIVSIVLSGLTNSTTASVSISTLGLMDVQPTMVVDALRNAAKAGNTNAASLYLQQARGRLGSQQVQTIAAARAIALAFQNDPDPTTRTNALTLLDGIAAQSSTNRLNQTNGISQ